MLKNNPKQDELRKNGYEIFTGKRLKEAKTLFKREIDYPLFEDNFGLDKAKSNLGLFDLRTITELGINIQRILDL